MKRIALHTLAWAVCLGLGLSPQVARAADPKPLNLAVIPKGTTHVFWKSVEAGARQAAKELNVEIQWKGPLQENDRAQQIQIVEQFASQGVSGIVLSPLDGDALKRPVKAAMDAGIPVVCFDSYIKGTPGKDYVSLVATDNAKGGQLAGETLAKLIGGKGKVVLLRNLVGSANTLEREQGFLDAIAKHPGITVTVSNRYGGPNADSAKTTSLQMIDQLKEADGIFACNEPTVFGMLLALRQAGLAGKVKFVGFDASPELLKGLQKGEIDTLVVQDPVKMGYLGVKTLVQHLRGEKVDAKIDTGTRAVVKEDLKDPAVRKLVGLE